MAEVARREGGREGEREGCGYVTSRSLTEDEKQRKKKNRSSSSSSKMDEKEEKRRENVSFICSFRCICFHKMRGRLRVLLRVALEKRTQKDRHIIRTCFSSILLAIFQEPAKHTTKDAIQKEPRELVDLFLLLVSCGSCAFR